MWPGQTGCDAMTALLSMEMHALFFECVKVCECMCVRACARLCVCVLIIHVSSEGWQGALVRALQKLLTPTTNKCPQTVSPSLSMTFSLIFFLLAVVRFNTGVKSLFFFFTALWHPESFSFCSLGEAANALDERLKSLSFHLIVWRVNLISLPSCVKCTWEKKCLKIKAVLM